MPEYTLPLRKPDFSNTHAIICGKKPQRPTLFEFFMNGKVYDAFADKSELRGDRFDWIVKLASAYRHLGYDYVTTGVSGFHFPTDGLEHKQTISLNARRTIYDRASFDKYPWKEPEDFDDKWVDELPDMIAPGMKVIASGPMGILENAIAICGYDNLCMMFYDDPELAGDLFEAIGSRLVRYYRMASNHKAVGAILVNDDWGFKTQTMISPAQMRKYMFPWQKEIVRAAHEAGIPAVLHSCGNLDEVLDDIINDMKFDAKHSYEDAICPVEDFYEKWNGKIGVMGGIDLNFILNSSIEEIKERSRGMLRRSAERGGYGLGTGNSVPEYIPIDKYVAMLSVIFE